jgi:hypothetical protein
LDAPSVRNAEAVRGWALEAEPGARLLEHLLERQVKTTTAADQRGIPIEEFAVAAPAKLKREAVAPAHGPEEVAPFKGVVVNGRTPPAIE